MWTWFVLLDFNKMAALAQTWNMKFNFEKCKVMYYGNKTVSKKSATKSFFIFFPTKSAIYITLYVSWNIFLILLHKQNTNWSFRVLYYYIFCLPVIELHMYFANNFLSLFLNRCLFEYIKWKNSKNQRLKLKCKHIYTHYTFCVCFCSFLLHLRDLHAHLFSYIWLNMFNSLFAMDSNTQNKKEYLNLNWVSK